MSLFPVPVTDLLPHAPPMLCLDALLAASPSGALASATLHPEHILLQNGILDPIGFLELAAQTAGAMKGCLDKISGEKPRKGMLVAAQDFSFFGEAAEGETVHIAVAVTAEVMDIHIITATVFRPGEPETPLARGKLKVFVRKR
ncbi:MAG: hypothetical protein LBP61_03145 [Desulfovibrio sp.]|jgi:predicted hotdog family 3-hydroxylacyl-ACP dehydratase|nr:hypothetical protein [Desulfovibrio sp.]